MTTSTSPSPRELRELAGLSQEQLAILLAVDEQTVADWEAGSPIPHKQQHDLAVVLRYCKDTHARYGGAAGDSSRVLYGTAAVTFPALRSRPAASGGADAEETRQVREYPISEEERALLHERLQQDENDWLGFRALDHRIVLVNRRALSSFELISDDASAAPDYFSVAVYEALANPDMRQILEGIEGGESYDGSGEDAPFSDFFVSTCAVAVAHLGGPEAAWERLDNVVVELLDGERTVIESDEHEEALATVGTLFLHACDPYLGEGLNELLVELGGEGYYRASFYRLGALRLIEVPAHLVELDD